jgi:hypothetical protein
VIDLTLPIKTVAGLNAREHWRARTRRVKSERTAACLAVRLQLGSDPRPCVVTLTRLSAGTLDDDNLQGAAKAIRDGIADAIGVADNDPAIEWRYAQAKCKRGEFGMRVQIAPIAAQEGRRVA